MLGLVVLALALDRSPPAPGKVSLLQAQAVAKAKQGGLPPEPVWGSDPPGDDGPMWAGPVWHTLADGTKNEHAENDQHILDENKRIAKQAMQDVNALESDNDAELRDVQTDYDKTAGETSSKMNRVNGVLQADDTYEIGQFNTMKANIKSKIAAIMNPAIDAYTLTQQKYHSVKSAINGAYDDHNKQVNDTNRDFKDDVAANQQTARDKSKKAGEDYDGFADTAIQLASDTTDDVNTALAEREAELNQLRTDRETGNALNVGILNTINTNLGTLATTVQEDQVDHANRADELINGNGDGGGFYNHTKGRDVFTGENPPGTYVPSLATVLLAGETLADHFETAMEDGITTFQDAEEQESDKMEAHLGEQHEIIEEKHEETMEGAEEALDKFTEDMSKRVDEYDKAVVQRSDYNLEKELETKAAVEAVVEYLESTVNAIEGTAKRLAPTSDALLQEAVHKLSKAAGLSKADVAKHGEELGKSIYETLKEQIKTIDEAKAQLAANGTSAIKAIGAKASDFNKYTMGQGGSLNCTEQPHVCKTTIKEIAAQLKLDGDQEMKDGEDIAQLQAMVKKALSYPNEAKDLASSVENEQSEVNEELKGFQGEMNQDIPAAEAKNGKLVGGFQTTARNGVVKTRDALTAEINEMIEKTLEATEKIATDSFDESSALKGEVSKENTAAFEAMTTFMKNLETMAELRKSSQTDTAKYVDMAREVNEEAAGLIATLSEPLKEALVGARAENAASMSVVKEDLDTWINKQQSMAAEELQKVLKQVTKAGKMEWKERDQRAAKQRAMLAVIDDKADHGKALASHADAVFAEISGVVDKSVSTLNAVLAAVKEQLRAQADSADAQVAADAQAMAKEADELISKYHGELDGIINNYNNAVSNADAELDAELAADSDTEATQSAVTGRALKEDAQAVSELKDAANGTVGAQAVKTVDDANAVTEAAAAAAAAAEAAAQDEESKVGTKINQEELDTADAGEEIIKNTTDTVTAAMDEDEAKVDAMDQEVSDELANATKAGENAKAEDDAEIESGSEQADQTQTSVEQEGEDAEAAIETTEKKEEEQEKNEEEAFENEGKEAEEESSKEASDADETAKTIDNAEKIVEGEVDAVKDEETNRMKALDPSARLRQVQQDLTHVQTTIQDQTKLVSKEVGSAILASEELSKKVVAGLPEYKRTLTKLSPAVDTMEKNVPIVMQALKQQMDSTFTQLESKMRDISSNADGVKDRVDAKLHELKAKFLKTESKILDMLDMATYKSAEAMNRVKDDVEGGLKIDQDLNTEIEEVVQPKTDEYRGKMQNVFELLGMEIDHEAIMKRANQTMANEMALRARLANSSTDLEAAVRALNRATKQQLDKAFLDMAAKIAAVEADDRLSKAQKLAQIRRLKDLGRQHQDALAGSMGELLNAQFHEMHALDEKSMTAEALLTRSQALAEGENPGITRAQMQALQAETADKLTGLRRYISTANGDAPAESLLQTTASSVDLNLRTAQEEDAARHIAAEEAALRVLHSNTEHKAQDWLKSLQLINGV